MTKGGCSTSREINTATPACKGPNESHVKPDLVSRGWLGVLDDGRYEVFHFDIWWFVCTTRLFFFQANGADSHGGLVQDGNVDQMGGRCTAHDAGARDIAFVGRSVVPGFQEFDALGQMLVHANLFGRGKKSFRKLTYI